jgi:hypothetical protein
MTKSDWSYGDSWERFPIEPGQIWRERAGSKVAVLDLLTSIPDFMERADLIYCDPPWNTGNVNSFYTKAGIKERHTFAEFVDALFEAVAIIYPRACYIETGKQNHENLLLEMGAIYSAVQSWQITYYKKNPSYLIRGGHEEQPFDFSGQDDMQTPFLAMEHESFSCVADLCMGRGLTGITAYKLGKRFVGTELNKRRLAVLLDKTTQMGARWSH